MGLWGHVLALVMQRLDHVLKCTPLLPAPTGALVKNCQTTHETLPIAHPTLPCTRSTSAEQVNAVAVPPDPALTGGRPWLTACPARAAASSAGPTTAAVLAACAPPRPWQGSCCAGRLGGRGRQVGGLVRLAGAAPAASDYWCGRTACLFTRRLGRRVGGLLRLAGAAPAASDCWCGRRACLFTRRLGRRGRRVGCLCLARAAPPASDCWCGRRACLFTHRLGRRVGCLCLARAAPPASDCWCGCKACLFSRRLGLRRRQVGGLRLAGAAPAASGCWRRRSLFAARRPCRRAACLIFCNGCRLPPARGHRRGWYLGWRCGGCGRGAISGRRAA
jgi:hypothetical protein